MATKKTSGFNKISIRRPLQSKIIELVNMSELNVQLLRRQLGLELDKDPKTFTGTEDLVKDLINKLAKAKAKR
ncbi:MULTISPECIES: hypothetical protein [unclassified Microcoleus]|uniref:hypothetical protein n=1 Tax=unclassified Microcoleus TaxID=2642155 RepID=UPI002FD055BD